MSPDIEQISFPPSRPVSNEADVASKRLHSALAAISVLTCECLGASQYLPLPAHWQNLNSPSQEMTDFTDGSDALFTMYNEITAERDRKLAERHRGKYDAEPKGRFDNEAHQSISPARRRKSDAFAGDIIPFA